jgi:hypothetical protein
MNPFHFITHQAAHDLDASLAGKAVGHVPQRRNSKNQKTRRGQPHGLAIVAAVLGLSGFLR